jgi:hypothetical protein
MELTLNISMLLGAIVSLLLSVIAYFIKQPHTDFRKVEMDVSEVKNTTQLIKTEFKSGHDLLSQRVGFIEKRIDLHEQLMLDKGLKSGHMGYVTRPDPLTQ